MTLLTLVSLVGLPIGCNGDEPTDTKPPGHTTPPDPTVCEDHAGEAICDGLTAVQCDADGQIAEAQACDPITQGCVGGACVSCAPGFEVPYADAGAIADGGLVVEIDPAGPSTDRPARLRPVILEQDARITVTGPVVALRDDGTPADDGQPVAGRVLIGATEAGAGSITFAPATDECLASGTELAVTAVAPQPIAVRGLDGAPWADPVDLFAARDAVSAHVDLYAYADRVGVPADVYVVPHRDDRGADPSLADAVSGPVPVASFDGGPVIAWEGLPSTDVLLDPYDLVVDFGQDGTLDPGDLLDGLGEPAFWVGGDLSLPGPYDVAQDEVSQSFWNTMVVYWPDPPDIGELLPLVVISHGNGHDYTWYDYLGRHLASHGYVVISHRNDTQPGPITASATTISNTETFLSGLATILGGALDGLVDTHAIAWIGHSRGGEGVVIAYHDVFTGAETPANFTADDIVLVSSIAPTVFENPRNRVNPHGVWYHLLAGSRDGDVTGGVDIDLVQYFRILQNATGPSAVTYVQGADHNDFNCCGFEDADWTTGPGPIIGRNRAQQLTKSYYLALLDAVFRDQTLYWEYLARAPEHFRPDGTEVVLSTQIERADGDRKLVIDDFQAEPDPEISSSGGAVSGTVREWVEGALDDDDSNLTHDANGPFNGMSQSHNDANPARGIVFQWDEGDDLQLEFEVPDEGRDATQYAWVSFRACQGTRHPNTLALGEMLSFGVELVDGQGRTAEIDHRVYGGIARPYARTGLGNGTGWVNEFQTVRVPIAAFAADGADLDLTDIVAVRLRFGAGHGSPQGRVGLDDLELLGPGAM